MINLHPHYVPHRPMNKAQAPHHQHNWTCVSSSQILEIIQQTYIIWVKNRVNKSHIQYSLQHVLEMQTYKS